MGTHQSPTDQLFAFSTSLLRMFAAFDPRAAEEETQGRCTPLAALAGVNSAVEMNVDNQEGQEPGQEPGQLEQTEQEIPPPSDDNEFTTAVYAGVAVCAAIALGYVFMRPSAETS